MQWLMHSASMIRWVVFCLLAGFFQAPALHAASSGDVPETPDTVNYDPIIQAANRHVGPLVPGADLKILPGAMIRIIVQEDPKLNGDYQVNDVGAVVLGYIGPVVLINRTAGEAADAIIRILEGRDFRKANVSVEIIRPPVEKVLMRGMVRKPSTVEIGIGEKTTLKELLILVGGVLPSVHKPMAEVFRGGMSSALPFALEPEKYSLVDADGRPSIPYVELRNHDIVNIVSADTVGETNIDGNVTSTLQSSDVIMIGEVYRQGPVRFQPGESCTMMKLMFKIGGLPPYANRSKVQIIRRNALTGKDEIIKVDVAELMDTCNPDLDIPLQDGDRVKVFPRRILLF